MVDLGARVPAWRSGCSTSRPGGSARPEAVSDPALGTRIAELAECTAALIAIADASGRIEYLNPAGRSLLGLAGDARADALNLFEITEGMPGPEAFDPDGGGEGGRPVWSGETSLVSPDGDRIPVLQLLVAHGDGQGGVGDYATVCHDLRLRAGRERQLERLNRTHAALSECSQLILAADDEAALFSGFCRVLVTSGAYRCAWIGEVLPGDGQRVRARESEGDVADYLAATGLFDTRGIDVTGGPIGRAIVDERPEVAPALQRADTLSPLRASAPERDLQAAACLPVRPGARVGFVLNVHAESENAFDAAELHLLELLAKQLGYGVNTLRLAAAKASAERELELRGRAIDASLNGIMMTDQTDPAQPLVFVNPGFERITGYGADAVTGHNPRFLAGDDRDQPEIAHMRVAIREGREAEVVLRNYRADGSLFWNQLKLAPVRDADDLITHYIGVMNDVTDLKAYEATLEYQAHYDALTGLPNRSLLHDRIGQATRAAVRAGQQVAVVFLDLDHFKTVNDSFTHDVGDEVLRIVAQRLAAAARAEDTVARYAGDEFVLVVTHLPQASDLQAPLRRILDAATDPIDLHGQRLRLAMSAGVALYPGDGQDASTLLRNADAAMYRAKELGRNRVEYYTAALNARALRRLEMEAALRRALEEDTLALHYQPQVDASSGRIIAVEALARWEHPELGSVSPDEFIPLAEETGLIVSLGSWALRTACRDLAAWRAAGLFQGRVAVNVSTHQVQAGNLARVVEEVLRDTGLPPGSLELEITESVLMADPEAMIETMRCLRRRGVSFALDDFGTGYSSLGYLKRFAFDVLKIDKSFVGDITEDPWNARIAATVLAVGHEFGLTVVAEGVETTAQLSYLRRQGCDVFQGFFFSAPLPADDVAATLRRQGAAYRLPVDDNQAATVLLVDEDPKILKALRRALRPDGYQVLAATSPDEALQILAREPIRVVLADTRLPGMDGIEFLRRVRRLHPGVVRLALGGYASLTTVTDAVNKSQVFRYVFKPWDDADLRRDIRDAFQAYEAASG